MSGGAAAGAGDSAGVAVPPPFIYLGFLLLGVALDFAWPAPVLAAGVQFGAGALLIAAGAALCAASLRRLHRAGTTHKVQGPTTELVVEGPYRFSRNPIYLALALIHAGIGVAADSPWVAGSLVPTLVVIRRAVVAREEAYLERKFGEPYRAYKTADRRWL